MQAFEDFRDLRKYLRSAVIARQTMRDPAIGQERRDLATVAYTRCSDRIVELLDRLGHEPATAGGAPVLDVLEDVVRAIVAPDLRGAA